MRPENEARLRKIRRVSSILRGFCKLVLGLIVLRGLRIEKIILFPGKGLVGAISAHYGIFPVAALTGRGRLVVGLLGAVTFAITFKCVYHLHRLLGDFAKGEVFTRDAVRQLRLWGWTCVLLGVMNIAWPLIDRAIELHPPSGLGLDLSGDMVVNGLIIVAISWFMAVAAEMREEQDLVV